MTNFQEWTTEQWVEAIRNADSLKELQYMVGPPEDENELARQRLERLDGALDRAYKQYGYDRNTWPWHTRSYVESLEKEQNAFESKWA